MHRRSWISLSLVLAIASTANATTPIRRYEYLNWTTIAKWENGGRTSGGTSVITNATSYAAYFNGKPPATPAVDWSKEEVVAVALGTTTNGDYVEVLRFDRALSGPDAGSTEIHYTVRHQAPTGATTTPIHVLKVIKGSTRYTFTTGPFSPYDHAALAAFDAGSHAGQGTPIEPQTVPRLQGPGTPADGPYVPLTSGPPVPVLAGPFDSLVFAYEGGLSPNSETITISKTGSVTINRYGTPSEFLTGQAATAELQAVIAAFNAAGFGSLPPTINDPAPIFDIPALRMVATVAGKDTRVIVSKAGHFGSFDARVRPLVDAVRAITDRLDKAAKQAGTFTGRVEQTSTGLKIGNYTIGIASPLYNVLAGSVDRTATVNLLGTTVVSVAGRAKTAVNVGASVGSAQATDRFAAGETVPILGTAKDWSGKLWLRVTTHARGVGYADATAIEASGPIGTAFP